MTIQQIPGYLINSVTVDTPSTGPILLKAGTLITDAVTQAAVIAAGGQLGTPTDPAISAAVAIVKKMRAQRGQDERLLDSIMLSAYTAADIMANPQVYQYSFTASSSASEAEQVIAHTIQMGTIIAAYFVPNASSAPAVGSNSDVFLLNIYNATGVLVGQLCTATLNNANQMTKWVRFNLGTITNGAYTDGFTITYQSTVTGTVTRPIGVLYVVGVPN